MHQNSNETTRAKVSLRDRYRALNEAFSDTYVHQYGRGAGFGAETLGLIDMALYCLSKDIKFTLGEQEPKGFSIESGWEDYFLPLWPHTHGRLLTLLNRKTFPLDRIPFVRMAARTLLGFLYPGTRFMLDRPEPADSERLLALGFSADYWERVSQFCELLFVYRPEVDQMVSANRDRLLPNGPFVAVHVRRGDKITESPYVPLDPYVKAIRETDTNWPIYVASDDQRVVDELRDLLSDRHWIRGPEIVRTGYDQAMFNAGESARRFNETVMFLVELEIMARAAMFIGASPSNVFFLSRYRRGNRGVKDVGGDV